MLLLALRLRPACRVARYHWVLGSAAHLISCIPKLGHASRYMHDVLYWVPAEQRISYWIASLVWCCLLGIAPVYLRELCCPLLCVMSGALIPIRSSCPVCPYIN